MPKFSVIESLGDVRAFERSLSIRQFLVSEFGSDTFAVPTIAVLVRDGMPIPRLRKDWDDVLRPNDAVIFIPQLQGGSSSGGGKNPLAAVLGIALVAIAPWAAGAIGGALGVSTGIIAGSITGITMAGRLILGGVLLGGSALIQSLAPQPKSQLTSGATDIKQSSPVYNLQAQGNYARVCSPWRKVYGRNIVYGDFAEPPYAWYSDNRQILTQCLIIGRGRHEIYGTRIGNTPVSQYGVVVRYNYVYFDSSGGSSVLAEYNSGYMVHPPYQQGVSGRPAPGGITAPMSQYRSDEVSGQELLAPNESGGWIGGFVATRKGDLAAVYEADFEALLYYVDDNSNFLTRSISVEVQFCRIGDSDDNAIGDWFYPPFGATQVFSAATNQTQRYTVRWSLYAVGVGRYMCRMRRVDTKDTNTRAGHVIKWSGLKSIIHNKTTTLRDATVLIIQLEATDSLSSQGDRKISSDVCGYDWVRQGGSWQYIVNRNPWWAAMDILRASYGAKLSDAQIDIATAESLSAKSAAAGEYFDFVSESSEAAGSALTRALEVTRAIWYQRGGKVRFYRDEPRSSYALAIHDGNTIAGSVTLKYVTATESLTDSVQAEYWDVSTSNWVQTGKMSPYSNPTNPAKIRLEGISSKTHAEQIALYKARNNALRRVFLTSSHEMDGFLPSPGDKVAIALSRIKWGQQASIDYVNDLEITVSADFIWSDSQPHFAAFTLPSGGLSAAYPINRGSSDNVFLLATLLLHLRTVADGVPTQVMFGIGNGSIVRDGLVISASPRDQYTTDLVTVIDNMGVYN